MSKPSEQITRIQQLEDIEKSVTKFIELIANLLSELSKDKPVSKNVEAGANQVAKSLESIESGVMSQINYLISVSTSQPHAGSVYGSQKDFNLAHVRNEILKHQINELERILLTFNQNFSH